MLSWETADAPVISIIIPTRAQHWILGECLTSLFELTSYPNYEVIVVDTGSIQPETFALYRRYEGMQHFRKISFIGANFNFSAACNQGVLGSTGKLLLFLNNDTKIVQADWLNRLAQWFENDEIGIVGPKLLYPDDTIQHAGIIVGLAGLAGHLFNGATEGQWSVFGSNLWYRNLQAVTGACLMISSNVFKQVNGFDESFELNFSDVDLGLRVHAAGYRVIFTPDVRLIHHESISHKSKIPRSDFERANALWQHWIQKGDPYFNQNLSYRRGVPFPSLDDSDSSSAVNQEMMRKLPQGAIISLSRANERRH